MGGDHVGMLAIINASEADYQSLTQSINNSAGAAKRMADIKLVSAVLQNIALILATPKGSAPFYRDFGVTNEFLDKPLPVAKAMMISGVREAIEDWEPRAKVINISFEGDALEPGKLVPVVEVEISAGE